MRSASRATAVLVALACAAFTSACGGADPVAEASSPAGPTRAAEPRLQLAARAAAAQDLRQIAQYTFKSAGKPTDRPQRNVVVTLAGDESWRIDVQGGALGGTVDIALVRTGGKLYHCALASSTYPTPGCVEISKMAGGFDPKIQHLFTDWLGVFTDREVALVVSTANPILGTTGACFSVDTSTVSVASPVDAGIYCYAEDGTLTAAKTSFGTLALVAAPAAGPPTVTLPAAVVPGKPLPIASPSPSASPSGSASTAPKP